MEIVERHLGRERCELASQREIVVGALVGQFSRQTKKFFISLHREPPLTQLRFLQQSRRREFLPSHCGILRSRDVFLQPEHSGIHRFERR
jgi:hypothetical protein